MKKNMQKVFQYVRRHPFTTMCIILVWVLSLLPFFPETPLDNVAFIDKWTHLVMYGGTCSVLWIEALLRPLPKGGVGGRLLTVWLALVLMGGLLELLQAYATTTRNGDWLDFAANTLGVTLGTLFGLVLMTIARKR
jgi:VanZ family protein